MAKRQQFFAFIGFLVAVESGLVNSLDWYNSQRYSPKQQYPQQSQRQNSIDIVQGTIDQLNGIDAKWVCTNPKTGAQMIFGTEIVNGNIVDNSAYLRQYTATSNTVPWIVQPWNNLQEQASGCDRSPKRGTQNPLQENNEAPLAPEPLTVEQLRKKFANWDWTQYVTMQPMNNVAHGSMSAVTHEPARTMAPTSPTAIGNDGQGVLEPRSRPST